MDICPFNNCPCDTCLHQEYLSCHWPDLHQTLKVGPWNNLEDIPFMTVKFAKNFAKKKIAKKMFTKKKFWQKVVFWQNYILRKKKFWQKVFFGQNYILRKKKFCPQKILPTKNLSTKKFRLTLASEIVFSHHVD